MVRSLSWREGIIWIRLMVASCQPHGLAGQEERELTHDFPKASAAGSSIMVMGQEPCIAEAFLPFVQYEGCEGKQLAQQPWLGKQGPVAGIFSSCQHCTRGRSWVGSWSRSAHCLLKEKRVHQFGSPEWLNCVSGSWTVSNYGRIWSLCSLIQSRGSSCSLQVFFP